MEIFINGEKKELTEQLKLLNLIQKFKINSKNLIIEINGEFVDNQNYEKVVVKAGDKIELIRFIGGG